MQTVTNPRFANEPGVQMLILVLAVVGYVLTLLGIYDDTVRSFRKIGKDPAEALKFTEVFYVKYIIHMVTLFSYFINLWYNTPLVFSFDLGAVVVFGLGILAEFALFYRVYRHLEDSQKKRVILVMFAVFCGMSGFVIIFSFLCYQDVDRWHYIGRTIAILAGLILAISLCDLRVIWMHHAIPGLSWYAYVFGFLGSLLLLISSALSRDVYTIIRTAIGVVLNITILVVMVRYHTTRAPIPFSWKIWKV